MIHFSFQIVCLVVLRVCFAFVNMRTRESYSPDGVDFSHSSFKTFATHSYYSTVSLLSSHTCTFAVQHSTEQTLARILYILP